MKSKGAAEHGDWSSDMSGMCITEESDFLVHLLTSSCASNELNGSVNVEFSSSLWPAHESSFNKVSAIDEASYYSSKSRSKFSHSGELLMDPHPFILMSTNRSISVDLCFENLSSKHSCYQDGGDRLLSKANAHELKRIKFESTLLENSKKRSRRLENVSKTRKTSSKKSPKVISLSTNNEEDGHGDNNGQSTSNYNSKDDSNAPQESISKIHKSLDLTGKTTAMRGSVTDPHSLYARICPKSMTYFAANSLKSSPFTYTFTEKKRKNQPETQNFANPCPKWNRGRYPN